MYYGLFVQMELSLSRSYCENVGSFGFTIKQYLVKLACVIDTTGFRAIPWILEYRCSVFSMKQVVSGMT